MTFIFRTSVLPVLLLATLAACGGSSSDSSTGGKATFGVLSDTHLLDAAALGASGADFDTYLAGDRKMLAQSEETLDAALADLAVRKPDFLLLSGDLTKDGEKVNHRLMAFKLAQMRAQGIQVFVVPGNHDINNPDAVSYLTSPPTAVEQVTPAEFKTLYADCGYNSALYQDPDSLSYIAEPVPGVWLFAMDSCEYASNVALGTPVTAGELSAATLQWVLTHLAEAKTKGKLVLGLEHHGVVEHFTGQATQFPEYLLTGYAAVGKQLADAGMNLVFTGHYHANDISMKDFGTSKLYDCETGSTVTAPCPYRFVSLDVPTRTLDITTSHVTAIPAHPTDFVSFEDAFLEEGMTSLTIRQLTSAPYDLDSATAAALAPLFSVSFAAHYAGDENLTDPTLKATLAAMASSTDAKTMTLGQFLTSLWSDLPTADNTATITLP